MRPADLWPVSGTKSAAGDPLRRTMPARTSLLREEPGGWCAPKAGATIEVGHEKKVDLGVLRGADHDGRVPESPFTTVDRVCVEFEVTM